MPRIARRVTVDVRDRTVELGSVKRITADGKEEYVRNIKTDYGRLYSDHHMLTGFELFLIDEEGNKGSILLGDLLKLMKQAARREGFPRDVDCLQCGARYKALDSLEAAVCMDCGENPDGKGER